MGFEPCIYCIFEKMAGALSCVGNEVIWNMVVEVLLLLKGLFTIMSQNGACLYHKYLKA